MAVIDAGSNPADPPEGGAKGRRAVVLAAALILAEIVSSFESTMIYAGLATFYKTFGDPVGVGWLITSFMLVATISAAICGRLGDIYGRQQVLIIVMVIAACGSAVSAFSSDLTWVIVGRAIQGVAGAILPLCYGLVREHFPTARVPLMIGIVSGTASAGALGGLIVGGLIIDYASWRGIFIASGALAVMCIAVVLWVMPPSKPNPVGSRLDWTGAFLFCASIGMILYAIGLGEKGNWGDAEQLGWAAGGVVVLAAWAFWELRHPLPMIDVRLMFDRQIGLTLAILLIAAIATLNVPQIVLVMVQQPVSTGVGLGISATASGFINAPLPIAGIIASPLVGWLAGRHGARTGMIFAMAISTAGWLGLWFDHGSVGIIMVWMAMIGFATGALMAAAPSLVVEVAPHERTSEATGLAQIVRKIGMACGAQLIAVSLASSTIVADGGVFPDAGAYQMTYEWLVMANAAALLLAFFLPRRNRPQARKKPLPVLGPARQGQLG